MTFKIKIFTLLFSISSQLFAQSDVESKKILSALSKKFKTYDVVKTDFTLSINNAETKTKESQSGILYLKSKTNKYKIILAEQEIISDGKNLWTFLKNDNEVQLSTVSKDENTLNPAQLFTAYEKGYKSRFIGESNAGGKSYQNIELVPLADKSFSKIKMTIDKKQNQIYSLAVYDKSATIYLYTVKKLISLKDINDSFFTFEKKNYPKVDIQDLR